MEATNIRPKGIIDKVYSQLKASVSIPKIKDTEITKSQLEVSVSNKLYNSHTLYNKHELYNSSAYRPREGGIFPGYLEVDNLKVKGYKIGE